MIQVSAPFGLHAAPLNATYCEILCSPATIAMSEYNVQEQPAVFSFIKRDGDQSEPIEAYMKLVILNKLGNELESIQPVNKLSSYAYTIPANKYGRAAMLKVAIYADKIEDENEEEVQEPLNEITVGIIRKNPTPFPRHESWSSGLIFKNGEIILLDNLVYMWTNPVSGNSTINPKDDIINNPLTTSWVSYQNWPLLSTGILFARFALLGSAVFYDDFMFSQYGIDANGNQTSDYSGFNNNAFTPNILLDMKKGAGHLAGKNLYWDEYGYLYTKSRTRIVWREVEAEMIDAGITNNYSISLLKGTYWSITSMDAPVVILPDPATVQNAIIDTMYIFSTRSSSSIKIRCTGKLYMYINGARTLVSYVAGNPGPSFVPRYGTITSIKNSDTGIWEWFAEGEGLTQAY